MLNYLVEKWRRWRRWRKFRRLILKNIQTDPNPIMPRKPPSPYQRWLMGDGAISEQLSPGRFILEKADEPISQVVNKIQVINLVHVGHDKGDCTGEPIQKGLEQLLLGRPTAWQIRHIATPHDGGLQMVLTQFLSNHSGEISQDKCTINIGPEVAPLKFQLRLPYFDTLASDGVATLRLSVSIDPQKGAIVREFKGV